MKFQAGESGNPNGRPKGASDKRNELRKLLTPHAPALVEKAVQKALEGDTTALKLCLDRCIAPLRSTSGSVVIEAGGSLPEQGQKTLEAIYTGEIDALTGSALLGALADQAKLLDATEFEERLRKLEGKL